MQSPTRTRLGRWLAGALAAAGLALLPVLAAAGERVTVFAAASTATALAEIAAAFTRKTGTAIVPVHAASSILAKQIANGAPAQIYISANTAWMDYLAEVDAGVAASRRDLLANRLVLVAPREENPRLELSAGADLAGLLGDRRLAVGDPDHVPAGIYGRTALRKLSLWRSVRGSLARMTDVRAALALVERGEAAAGIVYASDARITDGVVVVDHFPADSHSPILYPAALIGTEPGAAARDFFAFLFSPTAADVFARHGFGRP